MSNASDVKAAGIACLAHGCMASSGPEPHERCRQSGCLAHGYVQPPVPITQSSPTVYMDVDAGSDEIGGVPGARMGTGERGTRTYPYKREVLFTTADQRWIPVTERLPDTGRDVLIARTFMGEVHLRVAYHTRCGWLTVTDDELSDVTHWRDLPPLPGAHSK